LQGLFRALYTLPIYSSEPDCREPNFEQELEPKSQPITDPFTAKVETDLEPSVIIDSDVLDEPESEVATELVPLQEETTSRPTEVEKPLIKVSVDFPVEPTIELLPSLTSYDGFIVPEIV